MKRSELGQSLVETIILTTSITTGVLIIWAILSERITRFIDLVLAIITCPAP